MKTSYLDLKKEMDGWCIIIKSHGASISHVCYENDLVYLSQIERHALHSILMNNFHGKYIGNFKIYFWDNKEDALQVIDWFNSIFVADKLSR